MLHRIVLWSFKTLTSARSFEQVATLQSGMAAVRSKQTGTFDNLLYARLLKAILHAPPLDAATPLQALLSQYTECMDVRWAP